MGGVARAQHADDGEEGGAARGGARAALGVSRDPAAHSIGKPALEFGKGGGGGGLRVARQAPVVVRRHVEEVGLVRVRHEVRVPLEGRVEVNVEVILALKICRVAWRVGEAAHARLLVAKGVRRAQRSKCAPIVV